MTTLEQAAINFSQPNKDMFEDSPSARGKYEGFKAGAHWERKRIIYFMAGLLSTTQGFKTKHVEEVKDWLEKRLGDEK